ncbi:MAG TPA: hypothetical protein PLD54_00630 [Candidatus Levybacteria bacterium]|nr:hypothetical protein [Candidatus Levybacteria bacterium]
MENGKTFGLQDESEYLNTEALLEVFGADPSVVSAHHENTVDFVLEEGEPMQLLTEYLQK